MKQIIYCFASIILFSMGDICFADNLVVEFNKSSVTEYYYYIYHNKDPDYFFANPDENICIIPDERNTEFSIFQTRLLPHFKDGKFDGISFVGIMNTSILKFMGFMSEDVLIEVNEVSLATKPLLKLEMIMELIKNKVDFSCTIMRGDKEQTFNYLYDKSLADN